MYHSIGLAYRRPASIPASTHASMAGLSDRFSTIAKARISHILDRAEDPAEALDYAYERQLETLHQVRQSIAAVVAAKKRLQSQETVLRERLRGLESEAREAIATGDEELARAVLERKQLIEEEVGSLDRQIAELEEQQQRLLAAEERLHAKVRAFRTRKEVIKAEYSMAEAQVQISEAANGVGEEIADVALTTQRAIDKTEEMSARAEAVEELELTGTPGERPGAAVRAAELDRKLEELRVKRAVDAELARLKAEAAQ
jgi:phage shock protein A